MLTSPAWRCQASESSSARQLTYIWDGQTVPPHTEQASITGSGSGDDYLPSSTWQLFKYLNLILLLWSFSKSSASCKLHILMTSLTFTVFSLYQVWDWVISPRKCLFQMCSACARRSRTISFINDPVSLAKVVDLRGNSWSTSEMGLFKLVLEKRSLFSHLVMKLRSY